MKINIFILSAKGMKKELHPLIEEIKHLLLQIPKHQPEGVFSYK